MQEIGKLIINLGIIFIFIGTIIWLFGKIPFMGKLPGDFLYKSENFQVYFPVTTLILLSLILSVLLTIITNLKK